MTSAPDTNSGALFGAPLQLCTLWADTNARLVEQWVDWQRSLWQPLVDLQTEWLRRCQDQLQVPPFAPLRGVEQLA
jgi:hypothetical protein